MKKQHHSQTSKKTVKYKYNAKDSSIMNVNLTSPKGNKANLNFIADPKKPEIDMKIKD